jgi:hypothetical protein|tara:strand:- start:16584 stop:18689 length:2106 start_codon:yes stop_codon:yes gene_type:complete
MSHQYKGLNADQYEALFANFLLDSWSYSRVSQFARNEKAFEMNYIYRVKQKRSASTVSGQAYHEAVEYYFNCKLKKSPADIIDLEREAFNYIEDIPANEWKLQKTTPTIAQAKEQATKICNALIKNFLAEIEVYNCKEIIEVERYYDEFITVNGVDVPLPCHAKVDLLIKTEDGKNVIVDHKSKKTFTDEKEVAFNVGKQAITYVHVVESFHNITVDEVWFIENKYTTNRDKSPQLQKFVIEINEDNRRLFDALLYEPLKRMIEAIQDPDYVYLMNEADNFVDKAELNAFWAQTMMAEVDDFDIPESKKELVAKRLKKIRDASVASVSPNVIKKFRQNASQFIHYNLSDKDMTTEQKIEHVLRSFNIIVNVAHKFEGYSNNTYLLQTSAGINLSSVQKYKLDIANALNVASIRIQNQLFVYKGQSYLAIEAPKKRTADLFWDAKYLVDKKLPLGLDNFQQPVVWDLNNHSTPHMLVCGATGSGKSVSIISTLEYAIKADVKDIVIFDPKFEFTHYTKNSNIEVYNEIDDIETMMELMVEEMNNRIKSGTTTKKLVIFDEFADALSQSKKGKELDIYEEVQDGFYRMSEKAMLAGVKPQPKMKRKKVGRKNSLEENLMMLAQKGRSSGYRIIAATQRASAKIIKGDTKVNFPVQVCYRVPKEIDSKVVLDEGGAEALQGRGDGLISSPEYLGIVRFQSFYKP